MSDDTVEDFDKGTRRVLEIVLWLFVWGQYLLLLHEMYMKGHEHSLSPNVWLLPFIYPTPWIIGAVLRRRIRFLSSQGVMSPKAVNTCNGWCSLLLLFSYFIIMCFGQLHAAL